jgi:hypothetical protein
MLLLSYRDVSDSRKASVIRVLKPWLTYLKYLDISYVPKDMMHREENVISLLKRIKNNQIVDCIDTLNNLLKVYEITYIHKCAIFSS